MRGKVLDRQIFPIIRRITPAYAGKSEIICICFAVFQDHPRLCGEKIDLLLLPTARKGSPPPMRGKVSFFVDTVIPKRITPAYAGKSSGCRCPLDSRQGSPPPMRGKDVHGFRKDAAARITPAYAGKRRCLSGSAERDWDHPRLCGEKSLYTSTYSQQPGSPPPMRGKGQSVFSTFLKRGITPAYAGKSFFRRCGRYSGQDHPRLCGEKQLVPRQRIE